MKVKSDGESIVLSHLSEEELKVICGALNLDSFKIDDVESIATVMALTRLSGAESVKDSITQLSYDVAGDSVWEMEDDN